MLDGVELPDDEPDTLPEADDEPLEDGVLVLELDDVLVLEEDDDPDSDPVALDDCELE